MRKLGLLFLISFYVEYSFQGDSRLQKWIKSKFSNKGFYSVHNAEESSLEFPHQSQMIEDIHTHVEKQKVYSEKCFADRIFYRCRKCGVRVDNSFSSSSAFNFLRYGKIQIVDDFHAFVVCGMEVYFKDYFELLEPETIYYLILGLYRIFDTEILNIDKRDISTEKSYWSKLCKFINFTTDSFMRFEKYIEKAYGNKRWSIDPEDINRILQMQPLFNNALQRTLSHQKIDINANIQILRDKLRISFRIYFPGCVRILRLPSEAKDLKKHCPNYQLLPISDSISEFNNLSHFLSDVISRDRNTLIQRFKNIDLECVILMSLARDPSLSDVRVQIMDQLTKESYSTDWPLSCLPEFKLESLRNIISKRSYFNIYRFIQGWKITKKIITLPTKFNRKQITRIY